MALKAVRVGVKGQIVLKKELRDEIGLEEGMLVEQELTESGILIKPIRGNEILKEMEALAEKISKKWPKWLTAVEAVRKERR